MIRLASFADRFRWPVVAAWIVVIALSAYASTGLNDLLSNRFDIPNTESTAVLNVLQKDFGQRGDSTFVLVVQSQDGQTATPALIKQTTAAAQRAADALGSAKVGLVQTNGDLAYASIGTTLEPGKAQVRVPAMRSAIGQIPGADTYLSGQTAINRDLQPIVNEDLVRGELIAIPIAIIVLLFIFGTIISTFVPLAFALATVPTTLGIVWIAAHEINMAIYVTNLVTLIGIGIAIDYSLLVVYRFREEMLAIQRRKLGVPGDARGVKLTRAEVREALDPTMEYAGHAVVFSGLTVAVGLAGLILLPLPFIRSMGVGGMVIPLISILAAVTLLPALLSIGGAWLGRLRVVPVRVLESRMDSSSGFWVRLSTSIMRRPWPFLVVGSALLIAVAVPTFWISMTPGSNKGLPAQSEAVQGMLRLERSVGEGTLAPTQIIVDAGKPDGIWQPSELAAIARLAAELRADPAMSTEKSAVAAVSDVLAKGDTPAARKQAIAAGLVNATGQYALVLAASRDAYGSEQAQDLARRIRETDVAKAGFPAGTTVLVGGGPAAGVDFIDQIYGSFPYLIIFVLGISFILLMRAFRSVLLPLKAVILNVLSVSAAYGLLVMVFQFGWGEWAGLPQTGQIEAWIPIFLFAMLFGLSMDYEVFLVTRMRELYDGGLSNEEAVAQGLQRTGRIVSAAAIILVAAFAGFLLGSLAAFQQFGLGLAAGILIDATLIRMILVPAYMRIAGDVNWYLPNWLARILRVEPSPIRRF
ncbi:MAG: MMPL family transporter [Thermoleophilia bacterium]